MKNRVMFFGVVFVIIIIIATMVLSGCKTTVIPENSGTVEETTAATVTEATSAAETTAGEPITLKLWGEKNQWFLGIPQEIIDGFQSENSNVTIQYEDVSWGDVHSKGKAAIATGTGPDLMVANCRVISSANGQYDGSMVVLNDYFGNFPLKDQWEAQNLNYCYIRDKMVGIPLDTGTVFIIYNKDMFDEFGVSYPVEGWTVEQFKNTAKKFADPAKKSFGFAFMGDAWAFWGWALNYGKNFMNAKDEGYMTADGKWDSWTGKDIINFGDKEVIDAAKFMWDLMQEGIAPKLKDVGTLFNTQEMFKNKTLAMLEVQSFQLHDFIDAGINFGIVGIPKAVTGWSLQSGGSIGIVSTTKHPDECWKFIEYISRPENQIKITETKYACPFGKEAQALVTSEYVKPQLAWISRETQMSNGLYPDADGIWWAGPVITALNSENWSEAETLLKAEAVKANDIVTKLSQQ